MISKGYIEDFLTKQNIIDKKIGHIFKKYYEITRGKPLYYKENLK